MVKLVKCHFLILFFDDFSLLLCPVSQPKTDLKNQSRVLLLCLAVAWDARQD